MKREKKQYQRDLVEPTSSDDGTLLDLDNYSDSREQGNDPNSPDINKKEINEDNDAMLKKLEDDRMHREEQLKILEEEHQLDLQKQMQEHDKLREERQRMMEQETLEFEKKI